MHFKLFVLKYFSFDFFFIIKKIFFDIINFYLFIIFKE